MDSVLYPTLILVFTLAAAVATLFKLRRELADAASVRISDIGKTSSAMSAEQLMAMARVQAGLPYSGDATRAQS